MNPNSLNVRRMLQLLQVVESGSINRAALQLHISQPALTRSINQLEQELGVLLLDRSVKGVAPTPYGELLLEHARNVRANIASAVTDIETMRDSQVHSLRVGVTSGVVWLLTQAISLVQMQNRKLTIKAVEGHTANLHAQLRLGELDVVICSKTDRLDKSLVSETIFEQGFSLWVRAAHPFAGQDNLTLEQLSDADWVVPQTDSRLRSVLDNEFSRARVRLTGAVTECSSQFLIRGLLLEQDRIALLSDRALELERQLGLAVTLQGGFSFERRSYEFVTRQGIQSAAVRMLKAQLKSLLPAAPASLETAAASARSRSSRPTKGNARADR